MSDRPDSLPEPGDDELARLDDLLTRDGVWDEPARSLEDEIVAAIAAESRSTDGGEAADVGEVADLGERRRRRLASPERVLGAAAAVAFVVAGVALLASGDDGSTTFALSGTDAAPDASAEVEVSATPAGLKLVLDVEDLEGAPDGYVYEAWVGNGDVAVSAGTFHLRGGDAPIELWAGVTDPSFEQLWITVEPIDDDLAPSGDARLSGTIEMPADE